MSDRAPRGAPRRFALVVSRFNDFVTSRLKDGAIQALEEHGISPDAVDIIEVPGAFEIPLAAKVAAGSGRYRAVVCLGAVIRGETPHFDYVAAECARGIGQVALDAKLPVTFGVLTTNDAEQAMSRAGGAAGNKGRDAALAALQMLSALETLG